MTCPHCGAPSDKTTTRGGLVVHTDPLRVNYRGAALRLTRGQAQVMEKLVRFGRASFDVLEGDAGRDSLRVLVHQLRARLPSTIRIEAVYGWGYALQIDDPARPGLSPSSRPPAPLVAQP